MPLLSTQAAKTAIAHLSLLPPAAEVQRCRADFTHYINTFGRNRGKPYDHSDFSQFIDDLLLWSWKANKHISIVSPPGLGKSTRIRHFLEWRMVHDQDIKTVVISSTENLAKSLVGAIRKQISKSEFQRHFPEMALDSVQSRNQNRKKASRSSLFRTDEDDDFDAEIQGSQLSKLYLMNAKLDPNPACEAVQLQTTEEMRRVDIAVFDDIIGALNANSQVRRDSQWYSLNNTWLSGRLETIGARRGFAIMAQNFYHKHDVAHKLRERSDFVTAWITVNGYNTALSIEIINARGDYTIPKFASNVVDSGVSVKFEIPVPPSPNWTKASLDAKEEASPPMYRLKFRGQALDDSDLMFQRFRETSVSPVTIAEAMRIQDRTSRLPVVTRDENSVMAFSWGYDIGGLKRNGDALVCLALLPGRKITVAEAHFGHGWTIKHIAEIINDSYNRGLKNIVAIRVESNAIQGKIVNEIRLAMQKAPWAGAIKPHQTGSNKADDIIGLPGFATFCEGEKFIFPASEPNNPHLKRLQREFEECPRFLKPGESPDGIMASWFAWKALEDIGFSLKPQEIKSFTHDGMATDSPWQPTNSSPWG